MLKVLWGDSPPFFFEGGGVQSPQRASNIFNFDIFDISLVLSIFCQLLFKFSQCFNIFPQFEGFFGGGVNPPEKSEHFEHF